MFKGHRTSDRVDVATRRKGEKPGKTHASHEHKQSKRFLRLQKRLGLRIRALRQEREMTLEAAGSGANMDFQHWQKLEAGQVNVTLATLDRVAMSLEVQVLELFVS